MRAEGRRGRYNPGRVSAVPTVFYVRPHVDDGLGTGRLWSCIDVEAVTVFELERSNTSDVDSYVYEGPGVGVPRKFGIPYGMSLCRETVCHRLVTSWLKQTAQVAALCLADEKIMTP